MSLIQIDEMAKVLIDYTKKKNIMASHIILEVYAEELYNAGYRKATEVAEEIFAEILTTHTTDIDGFFTMHITELTKLKKKYTEGEK